MACQSYLALRTLPRTSRRLGAVETPPRSSGRWCLSPLLKPPAQAWGLRRRHFGGQQTLGFSSLFFLLQHSLLDWTARWLERVGPCMPPFATVSPPRLRHPRTRLSHTSSMRWGRSRSRLACREAWWPFFSSSSPAFHGRDASRASLVGTRQRSPLHYRTMMTRHRRTLGLLATMAWSAARQHRLAWSQLARRRSTRLGPAQKSSRCEEPITQFGATMAATVESLPPVVGLPGCTPSVGPDRSTSCQN